MSFVSYAQNFEDVMLWRALKHVENGFYIDVGAQDPVIDSVSMGFYEQGWRGCHIEPTRQYSEKLRRARPDELVYQFAVGNCEGTLSFFEIKDSGLSTSDKTIALEHVGRGFTVNETTVPVVSLDTVFEGLDSRDVHWLKIDVEGAEKSVLESWQISLIQPWILVVESTKPMTQTENYEEWEPLVLAKEYTFAYFDGLNRYYVSPAHPELLTSFKAPTNVFDDFELSGFSSHSFCRRLESRAVMAESRAQQAESRAQQAQALADQRSAQLQLLYTSTSWRLTKPIRAIRRIVGGDFSILRRLGVAMHGRFHFGTANQTAQSKEGNSLSSYSKIIFSALQREVHKRNRNIE